MSKQLQIRNSTAEFLIFQAEDKAQGVQVFYKDETIWASQKAIAALFDVNVPAISKHLKNIFESGELNESMVVSKMEITTQHGGDDITQGVETRRTNWRHNPQGLCFYCDCWCEKKMQALVRLVPFGA